MTVLKVRVGRAIESMRMLQPALLLDHAVLSLQRSQDQLANTVNRTVFQSRCRQNAL